MTDDNTDELEITTSMCSDESDDVTQSSILEYGFIPVNYVITGTISECNTPQSFKDDLLPSEVCDLVIQHVITTLTYIFYLVLLQLSSLFSEEDSQSSEMNMVVPLHKSKRNAGATTAKPYTNKPKLNGRARRNNRSPDLLPELPAPPSRKRDMLGIYNKLQDDMSSLSKMIDPDSANTSSITAGKEPSTETFSTETSSSVRRVVQYTTPKLASDETWSAEFKSNSIEGMLNEIEKETAHVTQNLADYDKNKEPPKKVHRNCSSGEEETDYKKVAGNVDRINKQLRKLKEKPRAYLSPGELKTAEAEWDSFTPNVIASNNIHPKNSVDITSESSEDPHTIPKSKLSSVHLLVPEIEYSSRTIESECHSEISKISTPSLDRISSLEADKEVRQILGAVNTSSSALEMKGCVIESSTKTSDSLDSSSCMKVVTNEAFEVNSLKDAAPQMPKRTCDKEIMARDDTPDILKLFTKPSEDSPYVPNKALLNALLAPSGLTIKSTDVNDIALNTSVQSESEGKVYSSTTLASEMFYSSKSDTMPNSSAEKSETKSSLSQGTSQGSRSSSLDHTSHISDGPAVHIIKDKSGSKPSHTPDESRQGETKPVLRTVSVGGNSPLPYSASTSISTVTSAQISERCNKPRIVLPPKPRRTSSDTSTSRGRSKLPTESMKSTKNSSSKSSQTSQVDPAQTASPLLVDSWTSTKPQPDMSEGVTQTSGYNTVDRSSSPIRTLGPNMKEDNTDRKPKNMKAQPDIYNLDRIKNTPEGKTPKKPKLANPKFKYDKGDIPDLSKGDYNWQPSDYGDSSTSSRSDHESQKSKPKGGTKTPTFDPPKPVNSSASDSTPTDSSIDSKEKRKLEKALLDALYNKPPIGKANPETLNCLQEQLRRHKNELMSARKQLSASRHKMGDMFNIDRENTNPLENNM